MPAIKTTMPEARKAAHLYAQGLSQPQVAATLGRSRKSIRTALRHLGVEPRDASAAQRVRYGPTHLTFDRATKILSAVPLREEKEAQKP